MSDQEQVIYNGGAVFWEKTGARVKAGDMPAGAVYEIWERDGKYFARLLGEDEQ